MSKPEENTEEEARESTSKEETAEKTEETIVVSEAPSELAKKIEQLQAKGLEKSNCKKNLRCMHTLIKRDP
jgi:hypothetical protein